MEVIKDHKDRKVEEVEMVRHIPVVLETKVTEELKVIKDRKDQEGHRLVTL